MQPNVHDKGREYCRINFATEGDRLKAIQKLHEKRVNFSGVGNNDFLIPQKLCKELGKTINITHPI
jgi:hypothetical protein